MLTLLLCFVPQEAWAALLVIGGLLIIIGLRKIGFCIIGTIILLALLGPFFDSVFNSLPPVITLVLMVGFFLFCSFRAIFGKRVSSNIVSALILGLLKAPFRFFGLAFFAFQCAGCEEEYMERVRGHITHLRIYQEEGGSNFGPESKQSNMVWNLVAFSYFTFSSPQ